MLSVLLITGCIVDHDLYQARRAELTDDDGDGLSDAQGDCDDNNPEVYPDATERCNGIDDNCDSIIDADAEDIGGWFPDEDGDGFGDADQESESCEVPTGWIAQGGDCDDTSDDISPDGIERCNSTDDDCDGAVDEDAVDMATWFPDGDGDGYGVDTTTTLACLQPTGTAGEAGDCDDADAATSPGAAETCNDGIDNNCNGDTTDCGWPSFIDLTTAASVTGAYDGRMSQGIAVGDLTGDGRDELILGAYYALDPRDGNTDGMLAVFESPIAAGSSQTSAEADFQIWGDQDGLGDSVTTGDFDDDGYTDLLIGAFSWDNSLDAVGRAFVVYGPITDGFDIIDEYDWQLRGNQNRERLAQYVHNLGDVSGDGTDDFLLSSPFGTYNGIDVPGVVHLFTDADSGSDNAKQAAQVTIWGADEFDYVGYGAHTVDLDGDGAVELLLSASGAAYGNGAVYLFEQPGQLRGTLVAADAADLTWAGEENSSTGGALDVGDLDADGRDDFLVVGRSAQAGSAYFVFGEAIPSGRHLSDAAVTIRGQNSPRELISALTEDFNGDGAVDVLLGEQNGPPASLYVFYGPFGEQVTLYTDEADVLLTADLDKDYDFVTFGFGELNGDGVDDVVIGSRYGDDGNGVAYILPGISQ